MSGLMVINPGMLSLVQDAGRHGFHNIGITTGGPFDSYSADWANRLCENSSSAAYLEVLVGGLILESQTITQIAITGAVAPVQINDTKVESWRIHNIVPGDRISIGYATSGCRIYVAVSGGIQCPLIFGSASTVVRENLGGLYKNGKVLERGDNLPCNNSKATRIHSVPEQCRPQFDSDITEIRILMGYQHHLFQSDQLEQFFTTEYTISPQSDRMGYRLEGTAIPHSNKQMLSEGICLGAVQLPADGQPIILLCDRQTIGGYPKLGSVFSQDIAKLAQLMPGRKIQFKPMDLKQAQILLRQNKK
jgi:biotin-dependent carboxylase-like uncharacterized protein